MTMRRESLGRRRVLLHVCVENTDSRSRSKAATDPRLRAAAAAATADLAPPDDVQWIVDVDPVAML